MLILRTAFLIIILILLIELCLWQFDLAAQSRNPSFGVNTVRRELASLIPYDANGDGVAEIFMESSSDLKIMDELMDKIFVGFTKSGAFDQIFSPIPTGQLDYFLFFAPRQIEDSLFFDLWEIVPSRPIKEKIYRNVWKVHGKDIDGDGIIHVMVRNTGHVIEYKNTRLAVLILDSGKDIVIRGLSVFDVNQKEFRWKFYFGPQIRDLAVADINGDDIPEIVVGTYAPDNYATWNRFQDDSSYVMAFNLDGKLLWSRPIGGIYTGVNVEVDDFNNDGVAEILAMRYSLAEPREKQDFIVRLDRKTGRILQKKPFGQFIRLSNTQGFINNIYRADLNNDGHLEIVVGNTDGFVRAFNAQLEQVAISPFLNKHIVYGIARLVPDGKPYILCKTGDDVLHILDQQLQPIFNFPLPGINTQILPAYGKYIDRLVLRYGYELRRGASLEKAGICELVEFRRKPAVIQTFERSRQFLWTIIIAFGLLALLIYRRDATWRRNVRQLMKTFLRQTDLHQRAMLVDAKDRVLVLGKQWRRLLGLPYFLNREFTLKAVLSKAEGTIKDRVLAAIRSPKEDLEIHTKNEIGEPQHFRLSVHPFRVLGCTLLLLHDRSEEERFRRFKSWARVAQRVAHEIKTPLTSIKLNAEELKDILIDEAIPDLAEKQEYLEDIIVQADRLTKMSDRFMRFLQLEQLHLQPVDVNELIMDLIAQWLPERQKGLHIDFDLEPDLPAALLDEKQFAFMLQTLFFNALDSVGNKGRILIRTSQVEYISEKGPDIIERFVEIQIHDTGRGVPQSVMDKLGEPFVTTKESGTGLGLMIVIRLMEEHRGMFILENVPGGRGAVATLRFRVAEA